MVPVWMNFSDLFKVTIIQRQITWKWYNIQLYLQWLTYRESYNDPSNGAILNDLERPLPSVSRPMFVEPFMRYSASKNGATLKLKVGVVQWNTNRDLHTPYSTVSFRMTLSDLEWLSEIVNDTKRRAVSLRQLSFLFSVISVMEMSLLQHFWRSHYVATGKDCLTGYTF